MEDKPKYKGRNGAAKILWEADSIEEAARELKEQKKRKAADGDGG